MSDKYQNGKMYTIRYKNDDSISMYVYIRMYVYTYIRMYVGPVSLSLCVLSLALSLSVFDDSNQGAYVALFWSVAECQGPMYLYAQTMLFRI